MFRSCALIIIITHLHWFFFCTWNTQLWNPGSATGQGGQPRPGVVHGLWLWTLVVAEGEAARDVWPVSFSFCRSGCGLWRGTEVWIVVLWRSGGHRVVDGYELDLVTTHRGCSCPDVWWSPKSQDFPKSQRIVPKVAWIHGDLLWITSLWTAEQWGGPSFVIAVEMFSVSVDTWFPKCS